MLLDLHQSILLIEAHLRYKLLVALKQSSHKYFLAFIYPNLMVSS